MATVRANSKKPQPFTAFVLLPPHVQRNLHRSQVYLSITPGSKLLRIVIVPAEERIIPTPTKAGPRPSVTWLTRNGETPGA